MDAEQQRLTVVQAKFAAWLSWSQPFLHALVSRLDPHVRNVVLCNQTENLDRFPVQRIERLPNRYLVRPRLCVLAASYLQRTWSPDVLHAHFGWSGIRLLLLKQMLRIPLVVTFGGRDVGLQMKLPEFDRLYAAMLAATDQIICVSYDLRDKLAEAGVDPDRIQVIHRGTDLQEFRFVDRSQRSEDEPVRLLMVGRIVEKKGHRQALEALAPLVRKRRKLHLTVVGEGDAYHEVRRLRRRLGLTRHVDLVGATDHEGVRRHMREADLLLHCSLTPRSGDVEGIPNVVVEAQATGLPVIGTRHGGIPEAVREGETGLLVPERSVSDLERALRLLVEDRALRLRYGRGARAFVAEHFDLDRQVEQHLAVYEKVVSRAATDPEWRTRNWLPDDHAELMDRTILASGIRHPAEFSIGELLERLAWARRAARETGAGGGAGPPVGDVDDTFLPEASRLRFAASSARAASAGPSDGAGAGGRASSGESRLERIYNWKGVIPQSIKFPLKLALGRLLVRVIDLVERRRLGETRDRIEQADRQVFEYFRNGGTLDAWQARRGPEAARSAGTGGPPPESPRAEAPETGAEGPETGAEGPETGAEGP